MFPMAHVCEGVSLWDGGRTSAGATMAEAHCVFESFGDGHIVCCGEGVSDFPYTRPALSLSLPFIHREVARHWPNRPSLRLGPQLGPLSREAAAARPYNKLRALNGERASHLENRSAQCFHCSARATHLTE